jgi:hypothetical protein
MGDKKSRKDQIPRELFFRLCVLTPKFIVTIILPFCLNVLTWIMVIQYVCNVGIRENFWAKMNLKGTEWQWMG